MSRYKPNFTRGANGNILQKGTNLTVVIEGNPLYITGQLFRRQSFGRKKLVQIEQTGSRGNPEKDRITLEMKNPDGTPKTGNYTVKTYAYFDGIGGKSWKDDFEVV